MLFHQKTMLLFLLGGLNGGIWFSAIQCFPSVVEPIFYTPPQSTRKRHPFGSHKFLPPFCLHLRVRNALSIWKMVCNDDFTYDIYITLFWVEESWVIGWNLMLLPQNSEVSAKKPISVGPWGSQQGLNWDDGVYSTVRQLVITHGAGIDSIQIEYDKKGTSIWSDRHGGIGGHKTDKVNHTITALVLITFSN